MPEGKGTYGSKRGRPPKYKKKNVGSPTKKKRQGVKTPVMKMYSPGKTKGVRPTKKRTKPPVVSSKPKKKKDKVIGTITKKRKKLFGKKKGTTVRTTKPATKKDIKKAIKKEHRKSRRKIFFKDPTKLDKGFTDYYGKGRKGKKKFYKRSKKVAAERIASLDKGSGGSSGGTYEYEWTNRGKKNNKIKEGK